MTLSFANAYYISTKDSNVKIELWCEIWGRRGRNAGYDTMYSILVAEHFTFQQLLKYIHQTIFHSLFFPLFFTSLVFLYISQLPAVSFFNKQSLDTNPPSWSNELTPATAFRCVNPTSRINSN